MATPEEEVEIEHEEKAEKDGSRRRYSNPKSMKKLDKLLQFWQNFEKEKQEHDRRLEVKRKGTKFPLTAAPLCALILIWTMVLGQVPSLEKKSSSANSLNSVDAPQSPSSVAPKRPEEGARSVSLSSLAKPTDTSQEVDAGRQVAKSVDATKSMGTSRGSESVEPVPVAAPPVVAAAAAPSVVKLEDLPPPPLSLVRLSTDLVVAPPEQSNLSKELAAPEAAPQPQLSPVVEVPSETVR